ncbi:MAG: response regulator transcription factor [Pseudomonadota bacterium]
MRLLLIEDDDDLRTVVVQRLTAAQFVVDEAADGETGQHLAETGEYAAIVLDLGLPVLDGLSVLGRLRAEGNATPVLILTARDRWHDRVTGLRAGADDYLGKPFETEELLARLEALIRRTGGQADPRLALGELELDLSARTVRRSGTPVTLTPNEYRALAYLAVNRGRVVSKAELGEHIYAEDADRDPNVIEVTIARLRKKIGTAAIATQRGHGYVIR